MASKIVRVTLLQLTKDPDCPTSIGHFNREEHYYLPGSDYEETVAALKAAGFKVSTRFEEIIAAEVKRAQDGE